MSNLYVYIMTADEFWREYYKDAPNFPPSEAACDFAKAYAKYVIGKAAPTVRGNVIANTSRKWTLAEVLLDKVYHNPSLAKDDKWRDEVFQSMSGCPQNSPEGTYHPIKETA